MQMYSKDRIISLVFLFFLIHVPHVLSAEFRSGAKESNLTNDLYNYTLEYGFCNDFSGEVQRTWAPRSSSTKMPKDFKTVIDNAICNDLVNQLYQQTCDVAVGDLVVNISNPYCEDGAFEVAPSKRPEVFMVVPNSTLKKGMQKDMWIFAKAISWGLLVEMGITSIFVGVAIKYMEYRVDNAEFSSPLLDQFFMLLWFPFSVLVFHEGHVANKWSKAAIFIWLCMAFMVIQCYVANLSSILTNHQSQQSHFPVQYNYIGYRDGSSVKRILIQRFGFAESQLKPYTNIKEYHLALSRGSYNGGVDAIFDQSLCADFFINSYGSQYIKIGPISKAVGFGFPFPSGSQDHFNFAIKSLNVDESSKVGELRRKVAKYHFYQQPSSLSSQTQSLSAYNFGGLFIITGILTMLAIVCSEYSIWRKSIQSLSSNSVEASTHSTSEMIEVNGDLNTIEAPEDTSSSTSSTIHEEDSIIQEE